MESERSCEVTCSSWCSAKEPANPFEIEAAETLADLAQLAVKERGSEFPDKMRDKGKLVRKRVKSESPPSRPELTPFDSVASRPQHVIEKVSISHKLICYVYRDHSPRTVYCTLEIIIMI